MWRSGREWSTALGDLRSLHSLKNSYVSFIWLSNRFFLNTVIVFEGNK